MPKIQGFKMINGKLTEETIKKMKEADPNFSEFGSVKFGGVNTE